MTYSIQWFDDARTHEYIQKDIYNIPLDPANRDYQECLDAIILEGADCFEGDIPEDLQVAAEVTVYGDDPEAEPTVETVPNPLIVADDAERAEAQAVIDSTPTPVKTYLEA